MDDNCLKGRKGEAEAENYLREKGYKILRRNFKVSFGEIDLIAKDKDTIVFVEVKARNSLRFGLPREAVTYRKQQNIRKVALLYLQLNHMLDQNCRFDVIEILNGEITHLENCF